VLSEKLIQAAQTDPGVFIRATTGFPLSDLHKEWIRHFRREVSPAEREQGQGFKIVSGVVAPREHGKSSVVIGLVPDEIGRNPNIRIKYVTNSDDKAAEVCQTVEEVLESDHYRQIYSNVRWHKDRRKGTQKFTVQREKIYRDSTFESCGILATGVGGRCDLLILDDVCDLRNSKTPGLRRVVHDTIWDVFMKTVVSGGRIWITATVWHKEDYVSELLRKKTYPFLVYIINENFDSIWESVWPRPRLVQEFRDNPSSFNLGFRMLPHEPEEHFVQEAWLAACVDKGLTVGPFGINISKEIRNYFAGVDPAIAKTVRAKYTAIVTIGIDDKGYRVLSDIKRAKLTSPEQARTILHTYNVFHHAMLFVENNQYQQALIEWLDELKKIPLHAFYTGEQKHDDIIGLNSLAAEFKAGLWKIPDVSSHVPECDCGYCEWRNELMFYPDYPTSDLLMATWLAREALRSCERKTDAIKVAVWRY
jgi:hypothetical protein